MNQWKIGRLCFRDLIWSLWTVMFPVTELTCFNADLEEDGISNSVNAASMTSKLFSVLLHSSMRLTRWCSGLIS